MKLFAVRLPQGLIDRVKIRAIREKRTLQEMVRALFEEHLKTPVKREGEGR